VITEAEMETLLQTTTAAHGWDEGACPKVEEGIEPKSIRAEGEYYKRKIRIRDARCWIKT